jgi:2-polyprenyl-6-methoxyphenol hydroxylase-like FAD-dependent oxidoreductase
LTQTFIETELGFFNAHHYRYESGLSTFIVEVDQASFARAGFAQMNDAQTRALCERIFAQVLDGHALISNNSTWRQFPIVHNDCWRAHNTVLIGDALHTAHFSIGSGTRLAMEDAIALDKALAVHSADIGTALAVYETTRRPILEKLLAGANGGAPARHSQAHETCAGRFAMSYVTRPASRYRPVAQTLPRASASHERQRARRDHPHGGDG